MENTMLDNMPFELDENQIKMVSGGRADFSRVTARVDSTAKIVDKNANLARSIMLWLVIRQM
jgi:hypothetical protein